MDSELYNIDLDEVVKKPGVWERFEAHVAQRAKYNQRMEEAAKRNPYHPFANAEAMELAKEAGWPENPHFFRDMKELKAKREKVRFQEVARWYPEQEDKAKKEYQEPTL